MSYCVFRIHESTDDEEVTTTGNWPISRRKALTHPEIQADKEKRRAQREPVSDDEVPKSGPHIMDLADPQSTASDRLEFRKIGIAFDAKQAELALAHERIRELEAQVERMKAKKRKAIPNPNRKFMELRDMLGGEKDAGNALNPCLCAQYEIQFCTNVPPAGVLSSKSTTSCRANASTSS
jgi:hypothetical protein